MQIEKHDKSYIVKLEDGSSWRIWPGDIALTLGMVIDYGSRSFRNRR